MFSCDVGAYDDGDDDDDDDDGAGDGGGDDPEHEIELAAHASPTRCSRPKGSLRLGLRVPWLRSCGSDRDSNDDSHSLGRSEPRAASEPLLSFTSGALLYIYLGRRCLLIGWSPREIRFDVGPQRLLW